MRGRGTCARDGWEAAEARFEGRMSKAEKKTADSCSGVGAGFDLLLKTVFDSVLFCDATGKVICANEAAVQMFGYDVDDFPGLGISAMISGINQGKLGSRLKEFSPVLIEAECRRSDGSFFPGEVAVSRFQDNGIDRICFFVRDCQHRKRAEKDLKKAEAQIMRAERLETAGVVAGQIAHDFNNLLTPLLAYPALIRQEIPKGSKGHEYLAVIEKTTEDMSHLTDQLLSLSRRGRFTQEVFNVNDVVKQVISLMQNVMPANITVKVSTAGDLLPVKGGREQILRVLQNLCQNAVDAMAEKGGELRVSTENVFLDAPVGHYESVEIGEYVKVNVEDTGIGIPDEIKDKIFYPFFTTKKASKRRGSGLGLSIVHGIVKDHHGYIDLESTVGKGTTFLLYIPITREQKVEKESAEVRGGSESILIVDDDLFQVQVMMHLLGSLRYKVAAATSGEEALKVLAEPGASFDLAIVDIVMGPGMDGLETFKQMRQKHPSMSVMFVSGFERVKGKITTAQSLGGGPCIRKPLTVEKIGRAVRTELDTRAKIATKASTGGSVLIVDDEEQIRKLFHMVISTEVPGTRVDTASDGFQAVEAFRSNQYSVIVMDLYMPVMDGRQAYEEIDKLCKKNGWPLPVFIFCTGFKLPDVFLNIVGEGRRHRLLRKPVRGEALIQAVRQHL